MGNTALQRPGREDESENHVVWGPDPTRGWQEWGGAMCSKAVIALGLWENSPFCSLLTVSENKNMNGKKEKS